MNFSSNRNAVLLIMGKDLLSKMAAYCSSMLRRQEKVEILKASSGLDGILAYNKHLPCLVIVEDELPDMPGSSVSSILKAAPNGGEAVNVFFIGKSSSYLYNTNADYFFPKPVPFNAAGIILKEFFHRRKLRQSAFLLIFQFSCDECFNDFFLCFKRQLVRERESYFFVPFSICAFIKIGGCEKIFRIALGPCWEKISFADTSASFLKCSFPIDVLNMAETIRS